jgi:NTE family protein
MNYHFKNLVFEGGGVRGIAYVGALEVLDNEGILKNIKRVAGTSAGAMVAVLVGLNYTASEISEVLWSLNFQKFLDDSFGCARDFDRLINEYGWYKGDFFRNLMADLIKDKTGNGEATFKDLAKAKKYRDIYLIGADLSTGFSKVFCNDKTPNVKVADAARVSMSIPLFFRAVNGINNDGHIYVDGGLLDNYPIKVFDRASYVSKQKNERTTEYYEKTNKSLSKKYGEIDRYVYNKETLGFRLDSKEEIEKFINPNMVMPVKNDIKSLFSYTKALVTTLIDFQNNVHLHSDDWQRTIYIDTLGVNSTDFGISDSKKKKLVESGITNTKKYFMWYNNEEEKANK